MSKLSVKDVSLGYDGKAILKHLSFSVAQGDYVCIIGENGSGKSTLMKTILGLQAPLEGTIQWEDSHRGSHIGYLPQQNDAQKDFPATVKEVVLSGCLSSLGLFPYYRKQEKEMAKRAMEKMGILSIANQSFRFLSGGQRQRVLLARALCATKEILLLDEPVAGLDPKVTLEMYDLIRKINQEEQITILMISHDYEYGLKDATHVLHIGKEVFFGTKQEFMKSKLGKSMKEGNA